MLTTQQKTGLQEQIKSNKHEAIVVSIKVMDKVMMSSNKEVYNTPKSQDRYFNNPYSKILGSFILLIID